MLVLNFKQFIDKLKKNDAKVIVFYDGHEAVKDTAGSVRNHFDKLVCSGTEALLKEVKEFANLYPAKFTCYAFTTDKAITKNGDLLHVDLAVKDPVQVVAPQQINEAEIIKRVTADITQKAEANLTKQKLELAEAKLDKLENASEKIALIALSFIDQFNGGQPQMQGTSENDAKTESGTTKNMNIEEAVHFLRTEFGDKTLIKLAQDPKSIAKLKLFL